LPHALMKLSTRRAPNTTTGTALMIAASTVWTHAGAARQTGHR
jgi:hypothetical protein